MYEGIQQIENYPFVGFPVQQQSRVNAVLQTCERNHLPLFNFSTFHPSNFLSASALRTAHVKWTRTPTNISRFADWETP